MNRNGILLIASTEQHIRAANQAARSARRVINDIMIDIFCDEPEYADRALFDEINSIENPHRRSKVDYLARSRFDNTLYIDSDVRIISDISEVFSVLDRFDIALCHAHARNRLRTTETWNVPIPESFPQFNGGVILYKSKSPKVRSFMEHWSKAFHEAGFAKDQVSLRELLWKSDLAIHTLPPEYNIRYPKYLRVWSRQEADPKILHFEHFKDKKFVEGEERGKFSPSTPVLGYRLAKLGSLNFTIPKSQKHREDLQPTGDRSIEFLHLVCYKWGRRYTSREVNILKSMVDRNLSIPHKLHCITDNPKGLDRDIETHALPQHLPGNGPKLFTFSENFLGLTKDDYVVSLDLDLVIVGNLDFLGERPEANFIIARHRKRKGKNRCHGAVYRLRVGSFRNIWDKFITNPEEWAKKFPGTYKGNKFSEQFWLEHNLGPNQWQFFPDQKIILFREDCQNTELLNRLPIVKSISKRIPNQNDGEIPGKLPGKGEAIVSFAGRIKPQDVIDSIPDKQSNSSFVQEYWH